jgi:putative endonuclease
MFYMASQTNSHIQTGQIGEQTALEYLIKKGYKLLEQNYRSRRAEVDIIVQQGQTLVFVEVKTRTAEGFGYPEEAVNRKKELMLLAAADQYIEDNNWELEVRFDIIAVTLSKPVSIHHIEDAFH